MGAGIVTTTDAEFRALVAASNPAVTQISLATRSLILEVLPQSVEVVWPRQGNAGYGTGPKKNTEQFAWILPFAKHVALAFPFGTELDDPARLLQGTGKLVRNVRLSSLDDVTNPDLRILLTQATTHRVPPAPDHVTVLS